MFDYVDEVCIQIKVSPNEKKRKYLCSSSTYYNENDLCSLACLDNVY